MANLNLTVRWQKYIPDLGTNRDLPKPFYVEIATGITRTQMRQLVEGSDADPVKREDFESDDAALEAELRRLEKVLAPFVRIGTEPLVVNEEPVHTLFDLLKVYSQLAMGTVAMSELPAIVRYLNSPGGSMRLMYDRIPQGIEVAKPPKGSTGRG